MTFVIAMPFQHPRVRAVSLINLLDGNEGGLNRKVVVSSRADRNVPPPQALIIERLRNTAG